MRQVRGIARGAGVVVGLGLVLVWGGTRAADAPHAPPVGVPEEAPPGPEPAPIPQEVLQGLTSGWVPPDADAPVRVKLRVYHGILRRVAEIERTYPEAPNLYVARNLKLHTMRALFRAEGDKVWQDRLIALARTILDSDAPPEGKIHADLLLLQAALASLDDPEAQGCAIEDFVARYDETPAAPGALMAALNLCMEYGREELYRGLFGRLRSYQNEPGVAEFMASQSGKQEHQGDPFVARLPRLHGGELRLPRDLLGQVVLLHFWTIETSDILGDMAWKKEVYAEFRANGLEIVGVNLDRSRRKVEQYVRDHELPWIHIWSGEGATGGVVQQYGVPRIPSHWTVDRDGRVIWIEKPGAGKWEMGRARNGIRSWVLEDESFRADLRYYRSGEFLAASPVLVREAAGPGTRVPQDRLDAMRSLLVTPPPQAIDRDEKVRRYREALATGEEIEKAFADSPDLATVRNRMIVAAKWLVLALDDRAMEERAVGLARRLPSDPNPPPAAGGDKPPAPWQALADFVLVRHELFADGSPVAEESARILGFAQRYAGTPAETPASILAHTLALEAGSAGARRACEEALQARRGDDRMADAFLDRMGSRRSEGEPFRATLTKLDGSALALPDDLLGNIVVVHFWRMNGPARPGSHWLWPYEGWESDPEKNLIVVGINLDRDRDRVRDYIREHKLNWLHTFSGQGFDDPTARRYHIRWCPSTWAVRQDGSIIGWAADAELPGSRLLRWIEKEIEPEGPAAEPGDEQ